MILVVDNQSIRPYNREEIVAESSVEFVPVEFRLSEEWDGYLVHAQFAQDANVYTVLLDENNSCKLPAEIIAGEVEISVFGYVEGKPNRGTSVPYVQSIRRSGFTSDSEAQIPPTPDLYAQLIERFSKLPAELLEGKVDKFQDTEHAGKLLYIREDGKIMPLSLGEGLEVTDGVLRVIGGGVVLFEDLEDGVVLLSGTEFADLGNGVIKLDAEFSDLGDGTVRIN